MRLGGPQSRSGRFGQEEITLRLAAYCLFAVLTELSGCLAVEWPDKWHWFPYTRSLCKFICKRIYLIIYLLTPCSTVLLEQLTGSQLVKKFPAFYITRRFITAFTSPRHLSLS